MQKYFNTVTKRSGVAIEGASVAVTTYPAGAAAAIYSDDGITSIPGSIVTTDANGHFEFYAADGRYTLSVSGPGITPYTLHDVLLLEDPTDDKAAITALQESVAENAADIAARLPEIGTYALLRAYTGPLTAFYVRGVASLFDGGAGVFRVIEGDTTSADNGGTILVDAEGRRWGREVIDELRFEWFGALGDGSNDDTEAIQDTEAARQATGLKVVARAGAVYRTTTPVTFALNTGRFVYDLSGAIFKPEGASTPFVWAQTGSIAGTVQKVIRGFAADCSAMAATVLHELQNANTTLWENPVMVNGGSAVVMFDLHNKDIWSENNRFVNVQAHAFKRVFQFRRSGGTNSFARTCIHKVFGATSAGADYWLHVADNVAVYDSELQMFAGNNAGGASLCYAGGDMTNTTIQGVRVEGGAGYVLQIGPGATRKPRLLDVDDYLGFSSGLISGTYPALDGLEHLSIYPGVRVPALLFEENAAVGAKPMIDFGGAGLIDRETYASVEKDAWTDVAFAAQRGAYIFFINTPSNDRAAAVFAAVDDSNSLASAAIAAIQSAAGTNGETIEMRWASSSKPQFRWTGGTLTDPMSFRVLGMGLSA